MIATDLYLLRNPRTRDTLNKTRLSNVSTYGTNQRDAVMCPACLRGANDRWP